MALHEFRIGTVWTGNNGTGTKTYLGYARDHAIHAEGKAAINGSSDPAFRGDPERYSPEELLVASLSACHMLWYLHLCSVNQVNVVEYRDMASGQMEVDAGGSGRFVGVNLRPEVRISPESDPVRARALHAEAHRLCFIANSVNFPVEIDGGNVVNLPSQGGLLG
jgi:organic hydroperoxide reductase OsmC/OhrA